jgi:hypothetical protein
MNFKSTIGGVLVGAFFFGAGSLAAQAATVVWDTGEGASGGVDAHYTVLGYVTSGPNNSNAAFLSSEPTIDTPALGVAYTYSNGGYPGSLSFISSSPGGATGSNTRTSVFQVTFNLDAASIISGVWAADNGAAVYNNGSFVLGLETAGNSPASNWNSLHAFQFAGVAGANVLNFYITDGGPPSGFGFDVQSVVAAAVPGPIVGAGLPGLLMALAGLVALRRRRVLTA